MRWCTLLAVAIVVSACLAPPPHAVVTVGDPDGLAAAAVTLRMSIVGDEPVDWSLAGRSLPVSLTVTSSVEGTRKIEVAAVGADDEVLARGRTDAVFARSSTRTATVRLARPCDTGTADGSACALDDGSGTGLCVSGRCDASRCGDGYTDTTVGEVCDDGNSVNEDACLTTCEPNICGDGLRNPLAEACDDGNTLNGDGCRGDCAKVESCGDGVRDEGEGCDDANDDPNDGCIVADPATGALLCSETVWNESLVIGNGVSEGDAALYYLNGPHRVVSDRAGNLVIADSWNNQVVRMDAQTGAISLVAGNGFAGAAGDGGPATAAELDGPVGLAMDGLGTVFIADSVNNKIRRVDPRTGIITTVAGTGDGAYAGDDGPATQGSFFEPYDVAVDFSGNLYVADSMNLRIRRIDGATGTLTTIAGTGVNDYTGDGGPSTSADIGYPYAVAVDGDGDLYFGDLVHAVIRRVDIATGTISTVFGTGTPGTGCTEGPATASDMERAFGLTFDAQDRLLITMREPSCIMRLDFTTDEVTRLAGTGQAGLSGDGGSATDAMLDSPWGAGVAPDGDILIADDNNGRIRRVDVATGIISTVVGGDDARFGGDGGVARSASFEGIQDIGLLPNGDVVILDAIRLRQIDSATQVITTIAGGSTAANLGDGGPMQEASLWMDAMAIDAGGNIYLSSTGSDCVRRIDAQTGIIDRYAGSGIQGFTGDGGPAIDAQLSSPYQIALDGAGNLYIADTNNLRVRRVDATTGIITTIAGDGTLAYATEGAPAVSTGLTRINGVAVDSSNNVYFTDDEGAAIRRVDGVTGILTTIAGDGFGGHGSTGDGGLAIDATLDHPGELTIDAAGNLYVSSTYSSLIRRIDATTGIITTVVGNGTTTPQADGSLAIDNGMDYPHGLGVDANGTLYYGEAYTLRRVVASTGRVETVAGLVGPVGDGTRARSRLGAPAALVPLAATQQVFFADGLTGAVRRWDRVADWVSTVTGFRLQDDDYGGGLAWYGRRLRDAAGTAFDPMSATLYVAERDGHTIRALSLADPAQPDTWTVATIAGALGVDAHVDGPLASARFAGPAGLAFESNDPTLGSVLYVAEADNHVVRRIALASGQVDTVAGVPRYRGYYGEGVPADQALLWKPSAVAIGPNGVRANGSIYVADTGNNRVRRVDLDTGLIDTVIGDGVPASSGVGAPARYFPVDRPGGLLLDANGNLFVTSGWSLRQVRAGADGIATGDDEVQTVYGVPPRDAFPMSVTACLSGLAWDPTDPTEGRILLLDACQGFLLALDRVAVVP